MTCYLKIKASNGSYVNLPCDDLNEAMDIVECCNVNTEYIIISQKEMNPKYAPAMSTVPDCRLTAGAMGQSIKQQEQQYMYRALEKVNGKF